MAVCLVSGPKGALNATRGTFATDCQELLYLWKMSNLNIRERIEAILRAESAAIAAVSVTSAFERAILALRDCHGKVLTTGMGKAGHIARKFAATLCSTGTPAAYIHPGEAAHGDERARVLLAQMLASKSEHPLKVGLGEVILAQVVIRVAHGQSNIRLDQR